MKTGENGAIKHGLFLETETFAPIDEPDPLETQGHASVMRQFLRNVLEGIPAETRSSDNIHSLAMVLGAIESGKSRQRVAIPQS